MSQYSEFQSPTPPVIDFTMRKLIRSKATRHFLTKNGHWTSKVDYAALFPEGSMVSDAIKKFQLHDVELYYLFGKHGTSEYDFTIPLR
jgi:hypothetical protein